MTFKVGSRKPQTDAEIKQYFDYWNDLLPTDTDFVSRAIPLAQFAHESAWSTSELARNANNHAGHKFKGNDGWDKNRQYVKDAEEHDDKGNVFTVPDTGWRKYANDKEFAEYHAKWLSRTPSYAKTYAKALSAKTWEEQLKALINTYATDKEYYNKVKRYIDTYDLTQYDTTKGTDTMSFPRPKIIDRRKRALGYPRHGAYAKRSKSSIKNIVRHYTAVNRKGGEDNTIKAHENYWRSHHKWEIGGYGIYIDFEGNIYWNYDFEIVTYGAGRLNPQLFHVCLEGSSYSNHTAKQLKALDDVMLWLLSDPLKHLSGNDIKGHKEIPYNSTACPGMTQAQLNNYRASITAKLKSGSKPVDPSNPQGMVTAPFKDYKEPRLPFDELKVGDTVTLDTNWQWANLAKRELLASPRYKELLGTKDKIAEVIKLDKAGNHSKVAYRLENYNSVILEEYLEESKRNWELKPDEVESPEEVKQKYEELQDGEYIDNDGVVWIWKKK